MEPNTLILGQDQYYSLDSYKTKLNNNVLVVGRRGALSLQTCCRVWAAISSLIQRGICTGNIRTFLNQWDMR